MGPTNGRGSARSRKPKTIENYVDGTVSDLDDKTTEYTYSAAGMTSLTAKLTGGGGQTTEWVYGVGSGSGVVSNDIVGATMWPDPSTEAARSGINQIQHAFSWAGLGRVKCENRSH